MSFSKALESISFVFILPFRRRFVVVVVVVCEPTNDARGAQRCRVGKRAGGGAWAGGGGADKEVQSDNHHSFTIRNRKNRTRVETLRIQDNKKKKKQERRTTPIPIIYRGLFFLYLKKTLLLFFYLNTNTRTGRDRKYFYFKKMGNTGSESTGGTVKGAGLGGGAWDNGAKAERRLTADFLLFLFFACVLLFQRHVFDWKQRKTTSFFRFFFGSKVVVEVDVAPQLRPSVAGGAVAAVVAARPGRSHRRRVGVAVVGVAVVVVVAARRRQVGGAGAAAAGDAVVAVDVAAAAVPVRLGRVPRVAVEAVAGAAKVAVTGAGADGAHRRRSRQTLIFIKTPPPKK